MTFVFPRANPTLSRPSNHRSEMASLNTLISSRALYVPAYQRNYSWKALRIETLLTDITDMIDLSYAGVSEHTHMLATIVLHENHTETFTHEIVDGQQRITTTLLILTTLLRELAPLAQAGNEDANGLMTHISNLLFVPGTHNTDTPQPRLAHCINQDRETFLKLLDLDTPLNTIKGNRTMTKAIEVIKKFLRAHMGSLVGKQLAPREALHVDYMAKVVQVLMMSMEVNIITTTNSNDAMRLFHDLNTNNEPLTNLDKIRAILHSGIGDPAFLPIWESFSEEMGLDRESNMEGKTDAFIESWLLSTFDIVTDKANILTNFIKGCKEGIIQKDTETLNSMVKSAKRWIAHSKGTSGNTQINGLFWANKRSYRQHRPMLMSAVYLEENEPKLFALLCEEIGRTAMVATLSSAASNTLESAWKSWALEIKSVRTADDLEAFLERTLRPAREDLARFDLESNILNSGMATAWKNNRPGKNPKQLDALGYLAYHLETITNRGAGAAAFMDTVTLEHIIPANMKAHKGKPVTLDTYQTAVAAFGNLTMLASTDNSRASDQSVMDKLPIYQQSNVVLTQASVMEMEIAKGRAKCAKTLKIIPRLDEDFVIENVNERGAVMAKMLTEVLVAPV